MRYAIALLILCAVGCSSSPTSPSPTPPVAVVTPPVAVPPVVTPPTPAPNPLLSDARFDLNFYRKFALGGWENPANLSALHRQSQAPRIYLRTIHDITHAPIDPQTLSDTAAALVNTAGSLTGVFGVAGLEQGTGTHDGEPGWITVHWTNDPTRQFCGRGDIGGAWLELYTNTGCRCPGGPAVGLRTVKHELGHVLGFTHTGDINDLMSGLPNTRCDMDPSAREIFHARVAYSQPIGSFDPK